jgi:hypothetical protein
MLSTFLIPAMLALRGAFPALAASVPGRKRRTIAFLLDNG